MSLETFVAIVCFVCLVASYIGYRYFSENVYLTYKEQKIPQMNTKKKGENR